MTTRLSRSYDALREEHHDIFRPELQTRTISAIWNNDIWTWEEAASKTEAWWLKRPDFGKRSLEDLKAALAKRDLYLHEDMIGDGPSTGRLRKSRKLYQSTMINFALAFAGLRETEIMMTGTLHGEETRFYPPRLYISRRAAEILRTHPELRVLDIQDGDAIAFDPAKRTDPERRAEIEQQLSASGAGPRCAEIIEQFRKAHERAAAQLGKGRGKAERRSDLNDKIQGRS